MLTIIAGIILVGVLFAAMAIGTVLVGRPLKGSCGGVGAGQCEACGGKPEQCKQKKRKEPEQR